jgi:hypothetical protein
MRAGDRRIASPSEPDLMMPLMNSKNCVERRIVYGIPEDLIRFSWASFARKYPLSRRRSVPTTQREMMTHAGGRLRREKIAAGRLEELQGRPVLEGRRVRHVDDDLCVGERFGQSLAACVARLR